ncbi:IS3 family transposase [Candidatus Phytoplasma sacchari]|uniref:IS3 family transposase n=1 Tax=Candidatus Phytoplasma sacchari TaxID=2609813 RepID=A0ABY7M104_9MOLU|nr:IS3 family transposase [Candidatus Phytoplasma sacchari]
MSPKIIKYYSLETKKAVVKAKLQGIKDKEIVKQFGLSYNSLIYNWLKKFKINNYPDTRTQYSLETKLKVIWAKKEEGWAYRKILTHFGLKSYAQVDRWVLWFNNKQFYRLEQPRGKKYFHNKVFYNPFFESIKKEIKQLLGLNNKKNKRLYLKIVAKYSQKVGLNQLLKWLNLSKSTYYNWYKKIKQPSYLTILDLAIRKIANRNRDYNHAGQGRYLLGYRRLYFKLRLIGFKVNPKTVYRKMKKWGCLCQTPKNGYFMRAYKRRVSGYQKPIAYTNLIQNNFRASFPYQKLCGDITYLPYKNGKNIQYLYLAVVMDLYNREIVSYSLSEYQNTALIKQTLIPLPKGLKGIFHTDQGLQFTNNHIKTILKEKGLKTSMSEKASPSQNACIESFFSNLKGEKFFCQDKKRLTPKKIKQKVTRFIEYYNRKRKLKYLGYLSPFQFKQQHAQII